ncbi:MAG TPA: carboxypeptidase regulatory-like domain-containing protein [Bryobacteraceae bacterium]|nr:carboxypeptidase regulatory-like domain-containing protein [Bryobacteraceae bacterium]
MRGVSIRRETLLPFLFAAFLFAPQAKSQATSSSIIGTVSDPTGATVDNAKVTATNVDTNVSIGTVTNMSGNYSLNQVAPGNYRITVEKPGFKTSVQENVRVTIGLSTRVDNTLQLGQVTEEVTVTETPSGVQTDRAEVSTTMSSYQVTQLPVFNRNFTDLTLLVPGATLNTFQHAAQENPQQSTLVNTNGQEFAGTNYLMDGMNNNDAVLGIVMVNPPLDSIGGTSIATSNYEAEFTQAGGAIVRVETKSGTNDFHGSAFEFLQNNVFQARNPFTQGLRAPGEPEPHNRGIPPLRWNQFGGSLGGPAIKDKVFWFGDYQGTRRRIGGSQTLRVPTAAERTGDLSELGVPIFDPTTGTPEGTGRQQFPGNVIPSSRISAPAANLLAALPLPNLSPANPAENNFETSAVQRFDSNQFDLRSDQYLTDKLRTFVRYSYLDADINAPGPFGLYGGRAFSNWGFTGNSDARNQNLVAAGNYSFSPTLLTELRFGYSRYRVNVDPLDIGERLADQVGIPGLNIEGRPDTFGLPVINVNGTGGFSMGYTCNCPLDQREFIYDLVSNWTKISGNHTFKLGGTFEHAGNRRLPSDRHRAGVFIFDPSVTSTSAGTGGLGLANFLLGAPNQFNRFAQISTNQEDRQHRMFYFVQDTLRITSKLTLNVGVRWDTWFPDYSLNDGQGGRYDVTDNLVRIPGVGGISKSADSETQWTNIAPRFAIAYAVSPKTVVRTGYGRSYYQGTFGWTFNNLAADVYPSVVNQELRSATPFVPVFPLTTAPPPVEFPTIPANGLLPLPDKVGASYIPADQKIPYVDQWNFTIEQAIADLNVSLGYVGNIGRHLNGGFGLNAAIPGPGPLDPRRPLFAKYGLTQGIFNKCDCTSSNYHALQVRAEKRFGQNYSLLASYTFSKALNFGEFGTPFNQYDADSNYGPASFDRTHVFTAAHTLILPFGRGQRYLSGVGGIARALVEGWQFNGITVFNSGLPFTPTLNNNASLNSDMTLLPNLVADPEAGVQSRNRWFNPSAYAVPAPFTFGNTGRNSLRGPNLFSANWALGKSFALTERAGLQFRWEVFNAFNRTNLGLPVSGVDAGNAGQITDIQSGPTLGMRNMQFGARLTF